MASRGIDSDAPTGPMRVLVAGRYELIEKLAGGGMAEVYLARQTGLQGFEKLVCLKRILPRHADNQDFVRMFINEARIAADLRHPNLVNVFDAGEDPAVGGYFIAMEYLEGHDLASIVRQALARHRQVPVDVALQIVADAARGLHAAHIKANLDGVPLKIVHRDISPQNLFVTQYGITKVLDFGVARAATIHSNTEVGVVKGKLAYMAPDQLEGYVLDGRADLYSLGVVLWELLALERLFVRTSDAEAMRAIIAGRIPAPSTKRPELPPTLDALVLKAVALRREDRFATCEAFADALDAHRAMTGAPGQLKAWLSGLFTAVVEPAERSETTKPRKGLARTAEAPPTNLVPPEQPLVGRTEELQQLEAAFDASRLVTLVGFGGMGKTRLAKELALRRLSSFEGGSWFVDLSDCRTAEAMAKVIGLTVSAALAPNAESNATLTKAGSVLNGLGQALVVLDNFEQLVPTGIAAVAAWLEAAPALRVLVTSREALGLPGERVLSLAPLPVQGAEAAGVQLFAQAALRARARPLMGDELRDAQAICQRLEGHPLALELAAARLADLSTGDVRDRLGDRFDLLAPLGARRPHRHATLWNTIDWSWQLLDATQQRALAQLAVFRGSFSVSSAAAIVEAGDSAETVAALVRKSLLNVDGKGEPVARLRMLDSIHEFALEKLVELDLERPSGLRHTEHYVREGRRWAAEVMDRSSLEALRQLELERENVTAAFDRSFSAVPPTAQSAAQALGALEALEPVFLRHGPFSAHLTLLDEAIEQGRQVGVERTVLARAYQQRGNLLRTLGRLTQAVDDLARALTAVEGLGADALEGRVQRDLGLARFVSGDLESAKQWLVAALSAARARGDEALTLHSLSTLAIIEVARGALEDAALCCDEGLSLAKRRRDAPAEARLWGSLAVMYQEQAKLELAATFFQEALLRAREVRDVRLEGYFTGKSGGVALEQGNLTAADALLREAIEQLAQVGDLRHEGLFLTYLSTAQLARGLLAEAEGSLAAAQVRLETVKDPLTLTALHLRRLQLDVSTQRLGADAARKELATLLRGSPSPKSRSEEVRLALRGLSAVLGRF